MRKIEREMLGAIHSGKNWKGGNTMVIHYYTATGLVPRATDILLHGNPIATVSRGRVYVNDTVFFAYPTRTTVSRLKALGIRAKADGGKGAVLYDTEAPLPAADAIR